NPPLYDHRRLIVNNDRLGKQTSHIPVGTAAGILGIAAIIAIVWIHVINDILAISLVPGNLIHKRLSFLHAELAIAVIDPLCCEPAIKPKIRMGHSDSGNSGILIARYTYAKLHQNFNLLPIFIMELSRDERNFHRIWIIKFT